MRGPAAISGWSYLSPLQSQKYIDDRDAAGRLWWPIWVEGSTRWDGRLLRITAHPETIHQGVYRTTAGVAPAALPGDCSRYVLGLYRKRSGGMRLAQGGMPNAEAFSIERLEGSQFGKANAYWVLNRIRDTNFGSCATRTFPVSVRIAVAPSSIAREASAVRLSSSGLLFPWGRAGASRPNGRKGGFTASIPKPRSSQT
jgi:hypothetical protein